MLRVLCVEAELDRNKQDLPPPTFKDHSVALGCGVNSTSVTKTKLIPEPLGNSKDRSAALNIWWVDLAQVVVSQLHMLRIPGSIPATHTNVGTVGTVL